MMLMLPYLPAEADECPECRGAGGHYVPAQPVLAIHVASVAPAPIKKRWVQCGRCDGHGMVVLPATFALDDAGGGP